LATPQQRREREKQDVRNKILDAARELFIKQGYEAVTMRQIAQKIAYTPTAIYFHFKDKEHLMSELCAIDFLKLARHFNQLAHEKDPLGRLQKMAFAYMDFGLKNPNHYRLLFMTPHEHVPAEDVPYIRRGDPAEDAYAFLRATIIECIAAGKFRKEYRDPELVAQVMWSAIHGITSLHIARSHDPWIPWRRVTDLAHAMVENLVLGMAARPEPVKPGRKTGIPQKGRSR
jgi:AcrR family transcriptional regulator